MNRKAQTPGAVLGDQAQLGSGRSTTLGIPVLAGVAPTSLGTAAIAPVVLVAAGLHL